MTRRQLVLALLGLAALLLSIPAALLGRAVLETPAAVARANAAWPEGARVERKRSLADRVADRILATDRVEAFARILAEYRRATADPVFAIEPINPVRLSKLIEELRSDDERAQAHVLVGAIFSRPAGNGTVGFDAVRRAGLGPLLEQATEEFRSAVRIDAENEHAKYDLELLLKGQAKTRARQQSENQQQAKDNKPTRQRTKSRQRGQRDASTEVELHAGIYEVGTGF